MSSLQNNPSNLFFPTQTNISQNQNYNSLTMRKSLHSQKDQTKQSAFSSMLYKTKSSISFSKQRLVPPQLQSIVTKIQIFVDDIDSKIQNRVQLVKQVYLNEYKQQVVEMSAQLKNLREKLDNQVMKQRANQKMFYLQEERDFFRHQVIKLNEQMNKLNEENKNLKKVLDEQKRQSSNYKQIVYNLESKLLKLKNVNIQRNMILTSNNGLNTQNNTIQKTIKHQSSTIDSTKHQSGSKTQRTYNNKPTKSLQTIQDQQEKQMSKTGDRLRPSHSMKAYNKMSTPQRQIMRSTATVTYPKLTVQRLQKIQGYSELLQRQHIIDECLNQLKRQIYYRNLSIGQKQSRLHFNQSTQIKFESFTKTDKKQLIIKLLSNQKILNEFYQFLFNPNSLTNDSIKSRMGNPEDQMGATTELINNKLDLNNSNGLGSNKWSLKKLKFADPKFNTQTLNTMKTQFNKKIFDIKHNR